MSEIPAVSENWFRTAKDFGSIHDKLALPVSLVEPVVAGIDLILLITSSVFAGIGYHWFFLNRVPSVGPYIAIAVVAYLHFVTIQTVLGAYKFRKLISFRLQLYYITVVWSGVFLLLLGIAFTLKIGEDFSRGAAFAFLGMGFLSLVLWREVLARLLASALAKGTFAKRKTVIIGERRLLLASSVLPELRQYGYMPAAVFEITEADCASALASSALRNALDQTINIARENEIDDVLLFIRWQYSDCIEGLLNALNVLPIPVRLVPDDKLIGYLKRTYSVGAVWTAELKRAPLSTLERTLKRTMDLIGASIGIALLSPLMLMTTILIRLDSKGPVIFTQWRSGFNGRVFRIFKFRTMSVLEDGPIIKQATRDDPRFTRLGRWLRRTNIDELPQLFNVLRGEMSLVGPRPHAIAHDNEYVRRIEAYAFRYHVKPGMTGLAQLKGFRGETHTLDLMSRRVEFDLWYIKHWSLLLDLKILLGTVTLELWRSHGY
jgi:Undecaprenyl-phosphate glucose phosphotransferase